MMASLTDKPAGVGFLANGTYSGDTASPVASRKMLSRISVGILGVKSSVLELAPIDIVGLVENELETGIFKLSSLSVEIGE
jgi:Na+/serine symporter